MLQSAKIEMSNVNQLSDNQLSEFGIVCLWSSLGLLLTALYAQVFGTALGEAFLMAG